MAKNKNTQRAAVDQSRADAFKQFLNQMEKERPGQVRLLGDTSGLDVDAVPTGAISLDVALGVGGFPKGRIIELYGPEMSGKTSLALSVAAQCQARGGKVGFIDAEHALSLSHAVAMGVDVNSTVFYQPDSGEDGLDMVEKMCRSGAFEMVIVDSVAALVPTVELEGEMGDQQVGAHARLMSKGLRKITGVASETNTMVVFINQLRNKIGSYGNPETTTGGKALAFYASVRIEVRSPGSKRITRGDTVVGQTCVATVRKNKVAAPHRVASYDLLFGAGIQSAGSLLDVAEQLGVVVRNAATYTEVATGERIGLGREKAKEAIAADSAMQDRLTASVYAVLHNGGAAALLTDESGGDQDGVDPFAGEFAEFTETAVKPAL